MLHDPKDTTLTCPCGSNKPFSFCCEPAIEGHKPASTAEALMRSRYTAFVLGAVDYLINSTAAEQRHPDDAALMSEQIKATTWLGLKILNTEAGQADDEEGVVEFMAHFETAEQKADLHERSYFRKQGHHWVYVDGEVDIIKQE
ncbi:YchJ family metal-binding protein [Amphritea sp. 1_MG-2023]|uniref:YchJ family protein n=1 Tax=Amphritea sp. 1_MG-2023 TaxID=3062670 RepID=UPI0026E2CD67|nr:YchJ family metal-binding protein [Amphritea sp. 1_MG-2023]MDO6562915.1 YchJ family metal-binding protein [Amphritea sp. 1_MG-2023]